MSEAVTALTLCVGPAQRPPTGMVGAAGGTVQRIAVETAAAVACMMVAGASA